MLRIVTLFLFLALLPLHSLGAQEEMESASPGVSVVSFFKCDFNRLGELNQMFQETSATLLDEMVEEGKLLSWGVLNHLWGDEWNWVVYYNAESMEAFDAFWGEYLSTAMEEYPEVMEQSGEMCSEHKDNIYSVVLTPGSSM